MLLIKNRQGITVLFVCVCACVFLKSLRVKLIRFTTSFLPIYASQMNIHAQLPWLLPSKIVIKGLSSWSNNASGTSKLLDLSLQL